MINFEEPERDSVDEGFPRIETVRDCCGRSRDFEVHLTITDGGYFLRATEIRGGPGGYQFAAHHPASPDVALGRLQQRIAEGLATRYLVKEGGRRDLGHGRAVGHVGYGCVVIDGQEISFDELASILDAYEGFTFEIRIADPFDVWQGPG
jgi:hypothetical protein